MNILILIKIIYCVIFFIHLQNLQKVINRIFYLWEHEIK